MLVRTNPDTVCAPSGAHHPHRWKCIDPDCDGWGVRCEYAPLICCVCDQHWPCETKQQHERERKTKR